MSTIWHFSLEHDCRAGLPQGLQPNKIKLLQLNFAHKKVPLKKVRLLKVVVRRTVMRKKMPTIWHFSIERDCRAGLPQGLQKALNCYVTTSHKNIKTKKAPPV